MLKLAHKRNPAELTHMNAKEIYQHPPPELFLDRGPKTLPISKDFSHSKNVWLDSFPEILANRDPFLRGFLPQNWIILQFFCNFYEMGPFSKDFFDQNGTHV